MLLNNSGQRGRRLVKGLLCAVLMIGGFMATGIILTRAARSDAVQFCAQTAVGEPWPQVAQRIAQSNADQRQSRLYTLKDQAPTAFVTFTGISPFDRHICLITLENNRISSKKNTYLD